MLQQRAVLRHAVLLLLLLGGLLHAPQGVPTGTCKTRGVTPVQGSHAVDVCVRRRGLLQRRQSAAAWAWLLPAPQLLLLVLLTQQLQQQVTPCTVHPRPCRPASSVIHHSPWLCCCSRLGNGWRLCQHLLLLLQTKQTLLLLLLLLQQLLLLLLHHQLLLLLVLLAKQQGIVQALLQVSGKLHSWGQAAVLWLLQGCWPAPRCTSHPGRHSPSPSTSTSTSSGGGQAACACTSGGPGCGGGSGGGSSIARPWFGTLGAVPTTTTSSSSSSSSRCFRRVGAVL